MKKYPKIVQIDARGQIVIPKDIRNELKAFEGTGFYVYSISDEGILLKKIPIKGLNNDDPVLKELSRKANKLKIDKSSIKKSVKRYKKSKEGRLEII